MKKIIKSSLFFSLILFAVFAESCETKDCVKCTKYYKAYDAVEDTLLFAANGQTVDIPEGTKLYCDEQYDAIKNIDKETETALIPALYPVMIRKEYFYECE
ncbi:MAG: hypothetical protein N4A45_10955 [Flavobacteriales bacterium]|jgi:hypothetical protein|nr:hypothetical protein [Flavobacteriales bacterium]